MSYCAPLAGSEVLGAHAGAHQRRANARASQGRSFFASSAGPGARHALRRSPPPLVEGAPGPRLASASLARGVLER